MPAAVRAHLRYPRELFDAQSEVWATYHMDNVDDFYTKADAWQRPAELSGPVQKVGCDPLSLQAPEPADAPLLPARPPARATAASASCSRRSTRPHSQENLSGYLTGTMDAGGRPRLTQLTLAARAPGARPLPGQPADPRHPGGERQAAPAQPGDRRPRQPSRQRRGAQRAARGADRRLVPLRPADLRDRRREAA